MTEIKKQIKISAPADKVWDVIADLGNVVTWSPTVVKSRLTTEKLRGVGAKRELILEKGQKVKEEIVEWNEGQSYKFKIPGGFGPIKELHETWSVKPLKKSSIVKVHTKITMKYGAIGAFLNRLGVSRVMSKQSTLNLAGLKHHLETGETVKDKSADLPIDSVQIIKKRKKNKR